MLWLTRPGRGFGILVKRAVSYSDKAKTLPQEKNQPNFLNFNVSNFYYCVRSFRLLLPGKKDLGDVGGSGSRLGRLGCVGPSAFNFTHDPNIRLHHSSNITTEYRCVVLVPLPTFRCDCVTSNFQLRHA